MQNYVQGVKKSEKVRERASAREGAEVETI